jgi:hypothetical protein
MYFIVFLVKKIAPNRLVEAVISLIFLCNVPGSDLGQVTDFSLGSSSCLSSTHPTKHQVQPELRLRSTSSLPHTFQFFIQYAS